MIKLFGKKTNTRYTNPSGITRIAKPKRANVKRQRIKNPQINVFKLKKLSITRLRFNTNRLVVIFLSLFILSIASALMYFNRDSLYIHQIQINDTSYMSDELVSEIRLKYADQFFFFLYPSKIEQEILSTSSYIKSVIVTKKLPDKLIIEIEEREPFVLLINRSEVNLISKDGIVLENILDFPEFLLNKEELDIVTGQFPLERVRLDDGADSVDEEINQQETKPDSALSDEEKKKLEEEKELMKEQEIKKKKERLRTQERDLVASINNFWQDNLIAYDKEMGKYIRVYSYSDFEYKLGQEINVDFSYLIDAASKVSKIQSLGGFDHILWISDVEIHLVYQSDKYVIVSTKESKDTQKLYEEVLSVIEDLKKQGSGFTKIDARGNSIVVGY